MMPSSVLTAAVTVVGTDTRIFSCDRALASSIGTTNGSKSSHADACNTGQTNAAPAVDAFCRTLSGFSVNDQDSIGWTSFEPVNKQQ